MRFVEKEHFNSFVYWCSLTRVLQTTMSEGHLAIKVSKCPEELARKWKMSSTDELLLRADAHKDDPVSFYPKNFLFKLTKPAPKPPASQRSEGVFQESSFAMGVVPSGTK